MTFTAPFSPVFYPVFGVVEVEEGGPLVYDTFTDTNGTNLSAHTPDKAPGGSSWIVIDNDCQIQNNRASSVATQTPARNAIDAGVSDCTITGNLRTGQTSHVSYEYDGLLARALDGNNYWIAAFQKDGIGAFLVERTGGGNTVRASDGTWSYTENTDYVQTVILLGTSITFNYTGGGLGTLGYTSAQHQSNTKHGISLLTRVTITNHPTFDTFTVEA